MDISARAPTGRRSIPRGVSLWRKRRHHPRPSPNGAAFNSQGREPLERWDARAVPLLKRGKVEQLEGLVGAAGQATDDASMADSGLAGLGHAGDQIDDRVAQRREHLRRGALAHPAGVLPQRHVAHVVRLVLDPPVCAGQPQQALVFVLRRLRGAPRRRAGEQDANGADGALPGDDGAGLVPDGEGGGVSEPDPAALSFLRLSTPARGLVAGRGLIEYKSKRRGFGLDPKRPFRFVPWGEPWRGTLKRSASRALSGSCSTRGTSRFPSPPGRRARAAPAPFTFGAGGT